MKWKKVELNELWLGDIFKTAESPDRVYQVDKFILDNNHCDVQATSFGKEASGLHFTGTGGPYYRLDMSGRAALDALATRNVELQQRCEQRDARYSELLAKWEAKRQKEHEEEERVMFDT